MAAARGFGPTGAGVQARVPPTSGGLGALRASSPVTCRARGFRFPFAGSQVAQKTHQPLFLQVPGSQQATAPPPPPLAPCARAPELSRSLGRRPAPQRRARAGPGCARRLRSAPPGGLRRKNVSRRSRDSSARLPRPKPPSRPPSRSAPRSSGTTPGGRRAGGVESPETAVTRAGWARRPARAPGMRLRAGILPGSRASELLAPLASPSPLPGPRFLKSFLKAIPHLGDRTVPPLRPIPNASTRRYQVKRSCKGFKAQRLA